MVKSGNIVAKTAIEVLNSSLSSTDQRLAELKASQPEMIEMVEQLREFERRETEFSRYRSEFEGIDENKLAQLITKVRPQLAEVGLPLKRSATIARFSTGPAKDVFATFDREGISDVNARSLDPTASRAELRVFAYDRHAGVGRCDVNNLDLRRLSFSIPVNVRSRLRKQILAAIDTDAIHAKVRYFSNRSKNIT